ncbi:hypothetical protein LUZ60_008251 [Juncus effusus]|nr:hypothetical protein LUZ60_008251 [Juncus effusus]
MARYGFPVQEEEEIKEEEERAEFSGRSCQTCTAFLLADCIALCCCPCAVMSFLTLGLVKAPWMLGKRCFAVLKKKRCFSKKRVRDSGGGGGENESVVKESFCEKFKNWGENEYVGFKSGVKLGFEGETETTRVWEELYQVGHWGFGRVSFSKSTQ